MPITGVSLLLKALMLGEYAEARQYFLPVLLPTIVYGAVALRWAVGQFRTRGRSSSARPSGSTSSSWLRHLVRDRGPIPSGGQAIACFAMILRPVLVHVDAAWSGPTRWSGWSIGQLVFILLPPLVMALLLTSEPAPDAPAAAGRAGRRSGAGRRPGAGANPLASELRPIVDASSSRSRRRSQEALERLTAAIPNLATAVLLFAVIPAICEEVAFRGFILSGLESAHRRWTAIVLSAFLFGFLHVLLSLFQQFFNATLLGLVLGLMAVRSAEPAAGDRLPPDQQRPGRWPSAGDVAGDRLALPRPGAAASTDGTGSSLGAVAVGGPAGGPGRGVGPSTKAPAAGAGDRPSLAGRRPASPGDSSRGADERRPT